MAAGQEVVCVALKDPVKEKKIKPSAVAELLAELMER